MDAVKYTSRASRLELAYIALEQASRVCLDDNIRKELIEVRERVHDMWERDRNRVTDIVREAEKGNIDSDPDLGALLVKAQARNPTYAKAYFGLYMRGAIVRSECIRMLQSLAED